MAGVGDELLLVLRVADFGLDGDFRQNTHHDQRKQRAEDAQRQRDVADASDVRKLIFDIHEHQRGGIPRCFDFIGVIPHLSAFLVSRFRSDIFRDPDRFAFIHLVEVQYLDRLVVQIDDREVSQRIHHLAAGLGVGVEHIAQRAEDTVHKSAVLLGDILCGLRLVHRHQTAQRVLRDAAVRGEKNQRVLNLTACCYHIRDIYGDAHKKHYRDKRKQRENREFPPQLFDCFFVHGVTPFFSGRSRSRCRPRYGRSKRWLSACGAGRKYTEIPCRTTRPARGSRCFR